MKWRNRFACRRGNECFHNLQLVKFYRWMLFIYLTGSADDIFSLFTSLGAVKAALAIVVVVGVFFFDDAAAQKCCRLYGAKLKAWPNPIIVGIVMAIGHFEVAHRCLNGQKSADILSVCLCRMGAPTNAPAMDPTVYGAVGRQRHFRILMCRLLPFIAAQLTTAAAAAAATLAAANCPSSARLDHGEPQRQRQRQ